jgi:hypothetical protein
MQNSSNNTIKKKLDTGCRKNVNIQILSSFDIHNNKREVLIV